MRVFIAVLALLATPLIAGVAQDRGSTPQSGDDRGVRRRDANRENCEKDAENSHRWQEGRHKGDKNDDKQCDPSGSTGGTTGGTTSGVGTVSGLVFIDMAGTGVWSSMDPGVAGWAIQLTGSVTLPATSDMLGNYSFTGVPAGNYSLCQVQPTTWRQTLPASGCYAVVVTGGGVVSGQNFGLVIQ